MQKRRLLFLFVLLALLTLLSGSGPVACLHRTRQRKDTRKTQVKYWLIIHYFAWHDQDPQDNAAFASIYERLAYDSPGGFRLL